MIKDEIQKKKGSKTSRKDEALAIPLDFEETLEALLQAKPEKPVKKGKSKPKTKRKR